MPGIHRVWFVGAGNRHGQLGGLLRVGARLRYHSGPRLKPRWIMSRRCAPLLVLWGVVMVASPARARGELDPAPAEMAELDEFVAAKMAGIPVQSMPAARLDVLANHDPVQRNARAGRPLNIAGHPYRRGLYCHAVSKVVVRLPAPGRRFAAIVGVDSNEQTTPGKGSVVFRVTASGRELFRSPLMREGMAGVPVDIELEGAAEFTLEVDDGGDGITCDQADWAAARVMLDTGRTLWLGDLPVGGQGRRPYGAEPPFSFRYGGRPSGEFLKSWSVRHERRNLDEARVQDTHTYTDAGTGLVVRREAVIYRRFPTVEWTLYFRNAGSADTPVISEIQAMDCRFERPEGGEFVLHHQTGSICVPNDYQPHETLLRPGTVKRFTTSGGRPTNSDLPYFNIVWPGGGVIFVIGWPGQWAATFERDDARGLRVCGGQELTSFVLHPGEEVRSPLIVLQFHQGDRIRAQNVWRRWMLAHNLPRPGGRLPPVQMAACSSHQFGEMIHANRDNQIFFIDRYVEEGFRLDYWWMDAGWYIQKDGWPNTGTWEVDTNRFPGGLRAICDHAHARGIRTLVWFEPERVTPGTWLYEKHPEWLLGRDGEQKLLNLGLEAARAWLTEHVDRTLREQAIDLYRQDFNIDPLPYWRAADAPDRQGITEIRHVTGYLAYWDELRRRHPNLLIDSCASGGRRNDLETLRRAVPLLRSDYIIEPVGNQCHTYGIAFWMPYYGTGSGAIDPYMLRSVLCPHFTACFDMRRRDLDYGLARRLLDQWRSFADCYFGDYYPLTPYNLANDVWMAWQFDRPDLGRGVVQAFRRAESPYEAAKFPLGGLDTDRPYLVTDLDTQKATTISGRELTEDGLRIELAGRPASAVITYERR